ncbi:MAG: hypothetical protein V1724_06325 [Chloroflexota bacterium]
MGWHYRIGHIEQAGEHTYGIVEFYNDEQLEAEKGKGSWTDFVHPQGESIEELRKDLTMMLMDTYRDEPPIELGDGGLDTAQEPSL